MFNFKKIASVLSSAVMLSSTVALASAVSYPDPFIKGGNADVAVVYGSTAATTDLVAVTDITANLQAKLAAQTASGSTTTGGSVSGEAAPLFTTSSPLLINATLKSVRETLTKSDLPTVLIDGTFEGSSSSTYQQRIVVGDNPVIKYAKQPSDNDDPQLGVSLGTSPNTQYVYNATVTFDRAVNFTHADSVGEDLTLFGQKFTVGAATTTTKLVLFKSSEKVSLSSDDPSAEVTIDGKKYTIDLVSASTSSAIIKVTDESGKSEQKEINEAASKKVNGIEVAVDTADSNNLKFIASVSVGANKITLQDGTSVKIGSDEDLLDGTNVEFEDSSGSASTYTGNLTKIYFQVAAPDSDLDAIVSGKSFVDPIFGSFKVDFSGISVPSDSTARENIKVQASGNDKLAVTFAARGGSEQTISYVYNKTDSQASGQDLADGDGDAFVVMENDWVNKSGYVILANNDEGSLFEITQLTNSSSATASDDQLTLRNVLTDETITANADSEGSGTVNAVGKTFTYQYTGAQTISNSKAMRVRFNAQETTGNDRILFPSIRTSKGAKLIFYEPTTVNLTTHGLVGANFQIQNGDGYTAVAIAAGGGDTNFTVGGSGNLNTTAASAASSATATVGKLTYNFTSTGGRNETKVFLLSPEGGNVARPAIVLLEEKDNKNNYEALIVATDAGYDGDSAGIGVQDIVRSVERDAGTNFGNEIQHQTDSDMYSDVDLWGSIAMLDKSDSDQIAATISYPDEQIRAYVYVGAVDAAITSGSTSSGTVKELGNVVVKDSEVSSVSSKNLVVVGGSCVNSVAASLLGLSASSCGSAWETKTGVGAGSFLIQSFDRGSGKIATLVAGYNAGDTTNAAKALTTQSIDTSAGKKYTGTSATSVSLVTQTA